MSDKDELQYLQLMLSIHQRLYYEARINDAARLFSWCRKPSKVTLECEKEMKEAAAKVNNLVDESSSSAQFTGAA